MTTTLTKNDLLTKEDEYSLIKAAHDGDKTARSTLMTKNQGLVHKIVQSFPLKNNQCTYDDLWQVGCMGFLHAIDMFDLSTGNRLSTYAYRWIHAYVRRYYQNQARVVRIPAHLADKKYQLDREVQRLTHEMGRTPSQEELEALVPGYTTLAHTFSSTISLNQELESGEEILDLQSDTSHDETRLQVSSLLDILKNNVSERDYQIFVTRYGVDGEAESSLNEVAEMNGITRARVHQIVSKCINLLKVLAD